MGDRLMERADSPLARNLLRCDALCAARRQVLTIAATKSIRSIGPRKDLVREGESPKSIKVVLEGWVARYKQLPDGHRQILSLMIPGDICDANAFVLEQMDHSLGALTHVRYAEIARGDFETLVDEDPKLLKALWWSEMVTASIQREWTANIGQRQANARIAHLFCEMHTRLQGIGLADDDSFDFPLTQADLGEATGLTAVHVNRTLQNLRKAGTIELRHKHVTVRDREKLWEIAMFDPAYLHG